MPFELSFGETPLTEQLLLIAIDPRSGRLCERPPGSLAYAAAGALLTDLLNASAATVVDRKVIAGTEGRTPLGEVFVRELATLPPQSLSFWVSALTLKPFTAQRYGLESLRRRGAITVWSKQRLGLWPVTTYGVDAVGERQRTIAKIAAAVTSDADLDLEAASLITLAASCGLIGRIVHRPLRRLARYRVRQIAQQAEDLRDAVIGQPFPAYGVAGDIYDASWSGGHGGGGGGHGGGHWGHIGH